ncbi:MAG: ABC transporter permease [Roseburia sp.]|nr:ABC transporter permease [Roseburia sp.]MCM1097853.1 ABC transporter permease [Ruminococcus flavefaciens]
MKLLSEAKKVKRTGFFPAFLGGAALAAAFPILNTAVRGESYLAKPGEPLQILLDANWQMAAMLNVLFLVAGACLFYHTEYADNAMGRMRSLPVRGSALFLGKAGVMALMCLLMLTAEAGAVAFCVCRWFEIGEGFWAELGRNFGYSFLLTLPCAILSLLIAECCRNLWISLGIGVICVFLAAMLPMDHFVLSLFPYALPFQTLAGAEGAQGMRYCLAAAAELAAFSLAEPISVKVRRGLE